MATKTTRKKQKKSKFALLKDVVKTSPYYGKAFNMLKLHVSPEEFFEMFNAPSEEELLSTDSLYRAMYHKVLNELFILKSMLQRLAYRSQENKELLYKTIAQIEGLENGIRERRETAKEQEREIPQQDFRKRLRLISETAHKVSDFVNNGFFTLKSEIQRTLRHVVADSPFYQQLAEIVERVEQSEEAINDLKSLHEGVIIRPKLFTIKNIFNTWNGVKTFKHATIQLDIRNGDKQFYGDEQKIRSFVNELVENALKHNPDHSDLQITIHSSTETNPFIPHRTIPGERQYLVITVRDNGKGIPPEKKEWIFIALNSTAEQGSGLGLFIIQRTLHKMGGHITETGTDGAHFTMYIPYQEREQ